MAALSRRRHHPLLHRKTGRRYLVASAISAFSAAALLFLAVVSFLTSTTPSSGHPVTLLKIAKSGGVDGLRSAVEEEVFRVPVVSSFHSSSSPSPSSSTTSIPKRGVVLGTWTLK